MPQQPGRLILGSRSPRRRELLASAGYTFEVIPPHDDAEGGDAEGGDCPQETPADLVTRLARQKAADVALRVDDGLILACDTVVECDGKILGKPKDEAHAEATLKTLSGRKHRVFRGLCLWAVPGGKPDVRTAVTTLRMDRLNDEQLAEYLASGVWRGKAGAFGYQDRLGWVHIIEGSESNVVGLPMELLAEMLGQGFRTPG